MAGPEGHGGSETCHELIKAVLDPVLSRTESLKKCVVALGPFNPRIGATKDDAVHRQITVASNSGSFLKTDKCFKFIPNCTGESVAEGLRVPQKSSEF